ncbi:MAG: DNA polymerase III subunit delta [Neisseria sp.]|nr:DNA polymerase III subunit delta [Neisseria sp.]
MAIQDIGRFSPASSALKPLYVFHGEEDLLRMEALAALRAAAREQGYAERVAYTAETASDWDGLGEVLAGAGLFADLRLLEIHVPNGKPGKAGGDALADLARNMPEGTVAAVVLPKLEKAQLQSKWFSALAQHAVVLEAKAVGAAALPAWLKGRLKRKGLDIEDDALSLFAQRVEGNLLAANQEIEKLALLHPQGGVVGVAEAEQAVADAARFDVFQLAAAWMGGDAARTARLLEGLEAEGGEPVLPLWALAEDVRVLIRLAAAMRQGRDAGEMKNALRLWGEKQKFAQAAAGRISIGRLIAALQECARIDRLIKGAEQGDAWAALRQLACGLAV